MLQAFKDEIELANSRSFWIFLLLKWKKYVQNISFVQTPGFSDYPYYSDEMLKRDVWFDFSFYA